MRSVLVRTDPPRAHRLYHILSSFCGRRYTLFPFHAPEQVGADADGPVNLNKNRKIACPLRRAARCERTCRVEPTPMRRTGAVPGDCPDAPEVAVGTQSMLRANGDIARRDSGLRTRDDERSDPKRARAGWTRRGSPCSCRRIHSMPYFLAFAKKTFRNAQKSGRRPSMLAS